MIFTVNKASNTIFCLLLVFSAFLCFARDTITWNSSISDLKNEKLVSDGGRFELGFFTPDGASHSKRYVGIWYYGFKPRTVVWVANRNRVVEAPDGTFGIQGDGTLIVSVANGTNYWSVSPKFSSKSRTVKLMNSGNLVLRDDDQPAMTLWESFKDPTDTFLPGMNMDRSLALTSWLYDNDPGIGRFTFSLNQEGKNTYVILQKTDPTGKERVRGNLDLINDMPSSITQFLSNFTGRPMTGEFNPQLSISRLVMNYTGRLEYLIWVGDRWNLMWWGPRNCSTPNFCGTFGSCNNKNRIACKCLPGFEPYNSEKWNSGNFSGGCTRISTCRETDTFLDLRMMTVLETNNTSPAANERECRDRCLETCQCQAYSYVAGTNPCLIWSEGVNDLQEEYKTGSLNLNVRLAKSDIEPTVRSCEPCGTNMIPYPLSTRPNCGDPMYYSFFCNTSDGQVRFKMPSGSYRVTRIDPSTRKFFIQAKNAAYDRNSGGNLQLNESLPFTSGLQAFDSEIEISWKPPPEPTCISSRDCQGWPYSTCDIAKDGKRRCLCTKNFLWNASNVNCTKEGDLQLPLQKSSIGNMSHTLTLMVPVIVIFVLACAITFTYLWRRGMVKRQEQTNRVLRSLDTERHVKDLIDSVDFQEQDGKGIDVPFFDMESILAATDSFSNANKLGQGGFGPVYKGIFRGGQELAIKRLLSVSGQGLQEFKNEVLLIAKLQHKNLVRLKGYCIKGEEKILLYEYMQNKSLDLFLFDESLSKILDWQMRINITLGIARGLLYLHHDSRLKIIHRDLKASNILLDEEMNPKISDFGLARIIGGKEIGANTERVVGTYGYMSPEYALDGHFSIKSDVFSFGVILLEIISGKKNTGFYESELTLSLIRYAWKLWTENKVLDLMDPALHEECNADQFVKCVNIGLLCVQENPDDRPTISNVVIMLESETATVPTPKQPAFVPRVDFSSTASSSSRPDTITESSSTFGAR